MGLFSTKYKTTVATQVARVIPDDLVPNAAKTGLIKAIFQDLDISDTLLEANTNSIGVKGEKYYRYGRDHYVHGVPSGYSKASSRGRDEVQAVLDALEGEPVTLDYCHMGSANTQHIGWMKLFAEHGYVRATNVLGDLSTDLGTTVWMDDMVITVPYADGLGIDAFDSSVLAQWGLSPKAGYTPERSAPLSDAVRNLIVATPPNVDAVTSDRLVVKYVYKPALELLRGTFTITVDEYDDEAEYFHAKYTKLDGTVKYWIYRIGAGTYPTLDAVNDIPTPTSGTFFPFLYFRYFKINIAELPHDEAWYKTSKKMAKIIGIDFDATCASIDENPDVDDVEQAMMMWAVPGNPETQIEKRYLYEFHDALYEAQDEPMNNVTRALIWSGSSDVRQLVKGGVLIADGIFKMSVVHGGIYKKKVRGNIGAIGSHASGTDVMMQELDYLDSSAEASTVQVPVAYHYYRKQVSAAFYDELTVMTPRTVFYIYGNYATIGTADDEIHLVPLDNSIVETYDSNEREILYSRSMHYVYNSRTITEIEWYQSEAFRAILIIGALVITVFSLGSGSSTLSAAIALGEYSLAAEIVAMGLLNYIVISYGVQLFVKLVGPEIAFLVAIVAVVAGVVVNSMGGIPGAPWASDLLSMASNLTKGIQNDLKDSMTDLLGQASEFQAQIDKDLATLEKAQDLLGDTNLLLTPYTIFGENPDQFYGRTVHSGNIGVMGIEAISKYVDIALKLPDIDQTIGEFNNAA